MTATTPRYTDRTSGDSVPAAAITQDLVTPELIAKLSASGRDQAIRCLASLEGAELTEDPDDSETWCHWVWLYGDGSVHMERCAPEESVGLALSVWHLRQLADGTAEIMDWFGAEQIDFPVEE